VNKTAPPKFKFVEIKVPRINCVFLDEPVKHEFEQLFRAEGLITSDNSFQLLFGNRVNSKEKVDDKTPKVQVLVEVMAEFSFGEPLAKYEQLSQVPFVANMLAVMYPYVREKVSYCFNANQSQFLLSPVNTFRLLEDNKDSFHLTDLREQKKVTEEAGSKT
jgi:preprotein translocase subunit SecB